MDFGAALVFAMVTRLFDRRETRHNPKAIEAVVKEARPLVDAGTWLESTVIERDLRIQNAMASKKTIN